MKQFSACLFGVLLTTITLIPTANAGFDEGLVAAQNGDYETALKEWKPLADQGNVSAQHNLALMYYNGRGVLQNYKQAVKWYRLAADQRNAYAQYNLGLLYSEGLGVLQDYKLAVKWYRLAAYQGYSQALSNLGNMYENGQVVLQDYKKAHMFYNISSYHGSEYGAEKRDQLATRLNVQQISEAQDMAREWLAKHSQ
ncbi:MAG: sel1 repeat family protein [Sneathiella sp.]|nr:sel1 repeat family protein [Sneathiella sp.]